MFIFTIDSAAKSDSIVKRTHERYPLGGKGIIRCEDVARVTRPLVERHFRRVVDLDSGRSRRSKKGQNTECSLIYNTVAVVPLGQ